MSNQRRSESSRRFGLESAVEATDTRRRAREIHDHRHGAESNDHLASIYETRDDQFAAVVPFVRQGLDRGERCLYVVDETTEAEVLDALAEGGIDVESALESGALSIHTKAETYLRTGEFDEDAMLDFWEESLAEARDAEGYAGVRAAAEMTWAVDESTSLDQLVRYEALLNDLYEGDDYVVLCQYNRNRFPPAVLSDVIRSHPLVVYDGTVCRNVYYHSPEEFFGADRPPLDVDRTIEGLVSRARTRDALRDSERQLRSRLRQQEAVADLSQRGLERRDVDRLLADAAERVADALDAAYCEVLELRPSGEELLLRECAGCPDALVGEATFAAGRNSLAGATLRSEEPVIVDDVATDSRFDDRTLCVDPDATSGISVVVGPPDDPWGVLAAHTRDRRAFSEHDATFVRSVASAIATSIERADRERYLRELYEIASDPERSFEEQLQAVFELGCERFGLDLGGIARVDPRTNLFEVEHVSGDHEHLEPGARVDLSETYCRVHASADEPVGITDPERAGFEGTTAYEEFGVNAYLGTRIDLAADFDRTCFFVSFEPRDASFTADEETFLSLMSQWLRYELERREYEHRLEASNERLEQFAHAASHDLQEPLRMVSSYLQLLEGRYGDELDADAAEFIDFAVDGADRMREMIDGLLDYSRVETRGDPFEPVDLDDVVDDVVADLGLRIDESDAELTVEELPRVEGDAGQLRQLVQNLLDNAIEYSGDEPPRIHVAAERTDETWVLSVADEGIGIDPDEQAHIFEVFERLHSPAAHAGTGIGLALCERIVERHGGEIWVESEPGEGSTFFVTLPAATAE